MPTIALIAAGPRLGLSLGRVFGLNGFDVALLSRCGTNLRGLVDQLAADGVTAAGFHADVTDPSSVTEALRQVADRLGPVEVMQYSAPYIPLDSDEMTQILDVTAENLRPQLEASCLTAITAAREVLPAMRAAGRGTLLFTTGASSVTPTPWAGSAGPAGAALRNWAVNLHSAVADLGIQVAHVAIGVWLAGTPGIPAEVSPVAAEDVGRVHWQLYQDRTTAERVITD